MELLIGYSIFIISILAFYLIKKEYLIKQDLILVKQKLRQGIGLSNKLKEVSYFEFEDLNEKNQFIHPSTLMLKSLRHLDFMSQLEEYLEASGDSRFKSKFLHEFEQNKIETQQSVLKSAQLLSKRVSIAA
ncbi:hypothetical protein [Winogradskyella vincentii]|uniref:Uncharacterized protein n=1 Tax=Winogradskyella vincentii TaxID=2877122 RepID=A0ABS7XWQ4_9FLAO|nr:hypothetical protein [Winogradskyella vincentii]MCA0152074.1 hypothetical protein [Winogradskyella vincentii]